MSSVPLIPYFSTTLCGHNPFFTSSLLFRRLLLLLLLLALHGDLGGALNRRYRHRRINDDRYSYSSTTRLRAMSSECYRKGRALKCLPNFDNVVSRRHVESTSTCGSPPTQVCRTVERKDGTVRRVCEMCDAKNNKKSHPASYLTDNHNVANETCWISGPVTENNPSVNLTVSFGKRFEILYIYLVPCGNIPDSIALYKSSDFGKTWRPWRYFSSNCYRAFGLLTTDERLYSYSGPQKVFCEQLRPLRAYTGNNPDRIVFSTTTGVTSNSNPALIDWRTATDLRIVLSKFPVRSNLNNPRRQPHRNRRLQFDEPGASYYSFSQLSVGGRCKCNGHSNQCILRDGKLVCDCKHNTEGDDCERCKPFFYDRPWARATETDANVCRQCNCHLHSNRCVFNKDAFLISGRVSGGVCTRCRHNTSGRTCHYCKDGFYRDWTKPISHERVCLVCNCHPLGSVKSKSCDKKSGQCVCKRGVTGQICDRCIDGYKQSNDPNNPCQDERDMNKYKYQPKRKCKKCRIKRRIRFRKFCKKHLVLYASMRSRTTFKNNVRFLMDIRAVYHRADIAASVLPNRRTKHPIPIWIPYEQLRCECPKLVVGKSYLIVSNVKTFAFKDRRELLLHNRSIILDWDNKWKRRMNKYKRRDRKGKCKKILRRRQHRGRKNVLSRTRPNQPRPNQRYRDYPSYQFGYQRGQYLRNYQDNFDNYGYYGYTKKRV